MKAPQASILLVDDHPANLLALEAILHPLDQKLVRALSGEEAIGRVQIDDFALVLMDVNMPGLDGFETVSRLRRLERGRDLPVIFVTAVHDDHAYMARGYALGAVDYVAKPFVPEFLMAKVGWFVSLWQRGELLQRQEELLRQREVQAARAELLREAAEVANRAKDDFLATVSHDLLTPLTAVIGWAEMLQRRLVDPERTDEVIDTILRCGLQQRKLIEDLVDVSRIAAGKLSVELRELELGEVLKHAVATVAPSARERSIEIVVEPGRRVRVNGDPARLQQLLCNLLVNAIKFSRGGGRVAISTAQDGGDVLVRVRDWGAGISPEFLPHVFERFRQGERHRGGLGLGLAIARHIAELHGGTLHASSAGADQGATLTLRLPMLARELTA